MRTTAGELSDKMKKTRDELEDDLKETRDVVKELKDFLSGKACFNPQGVWITWKEDFINNDFSCFLWLQTHPPT